MGKQLFKIAGSENSSGINSCPTVIGERGDDVNVIIQGPEADAEDLGLTVPAGENIVRIPRSLLLAAAREIAESA